MCLLWFYDDMMAKTSIEIQSRDKLSPTAFHYNSIRRKQKQPLHVKHHTYVILHSEAWTFDCWYKNKKNQIFDWRGALSSQHSSLKYPNSII